MAANALVPRYAIAAMGLAFCCFASPVQAVTCDEVRGLSTMELANWAKRLEVPPAKLAALLELSFCKVERPGGTASAFGAKVMARR